jgi:hypothetical protein
MDLLIGTWEGDSYELIEGDLAKDWVLIGRHLEGDWDGDFPGHGVGIRIDGC